jgi:hypothetical protein
MSQQKVEKKRARTPNFSPDEKVALLNLIKKYSHIIENKKTDAVTWQDKSKAWGEIIMKEIGTIQLVNGNCQNKIDTFLKKFPKCKTVLREIG